MNHFYVIGYQVGSEAICKLGFTSNIKRRVNELQVGNHSKLSIMGTNLIKEANKFERFVHRAFKEQRIRGEWYKLNHEEIYLLYDNMDNAKQDCDCGLC